MLKGGKDIDALFQEGLSDYQEAPAAYVWEGLEKGLGEQRKQRSVLLVWRTLAAACLAAVVLVSLALLKDRGALRNDAVMSLPLASVHQERTPLLANDQGVVSTVMQEVANPSLADASEHSGAVILPVQEEAAEPVLNVISNDRVSVCQALEGERAVVLVDKYTVSSQLRYAEKEKVYYPLYAASTQVSATRNKPSLILGGVVTPAYSSKYSGGDGVQTFSTGTNQPNEQGITSLGGGLQLRLKTASRWSFETGVLYARVGQSVENTQMYQAYSSSPIHTAEGAQVTNLHITNSMGSVALSKMPGAVGNNLDNVGFVTSSTKGTVSTLGNIKQTLEYVEVPLMARYTLLKSFPYLSLSGGVSSNILVGNTAYAEAGGDKEAVGHTRDIRPFVMSSSLGIGMDVPLSKRIRFNIEPRIKYFLNSVSANSDYSFQPYSVGVYGGVSFVLR
ncbi:MULTISPECIES: outer membrane beta-barrel protein [unclassified Carboxylicivirga]|uniref:outer membrane beta-barrel protein n=1 Tax=Carboxylicivirga TaxID=1628153 RepID=UPI003D34DADA